MLVRDVLADVASEDPSFAEAIAPDMQALNKEVALNMPGLEDAPLEDDNITDFLFFGGMSVGKSLIVAGVRGLAKAGVDDLINAAIPWGKGNQAVGFAWEDYIATNKPGLQVLDNRAGSSFFKTFDFFNPKTGTAISAKTLDLFGTSYSTKSGAVYSQLAKYVDDAASFTGYSTKYAGSLTSKQIVSRQIQLAIPDGASPFQMLQVQRAVSYGSQQGVEVVVSRVAQ